MYKVPELKNWSARRGSLSHKDFKDIPTRDFDQRRQGEDKQNTVPSFGNIDEGQPSKERRQSRKFWDYENPMLKRAEENLRRRSSKQLLNDEVKEIEKAKERQLIRHHENSSNQNMIQGIMGQSSKIEESKIDIRVPPSQIHASSLPQGGNPRMNYFPPPHQPQMVQNNNIRGSPVNQLIPNQRLSRVIIQNQRAPPHLLQGNLHHQSPHQVHPFYQVHPPQSHHPQLHHPQSHHPQFHPPQMQHPQINHSRMQHPRINHSRMQQPHDGPGHSRFDSPGKVYKLEEYEQLARSNYPEHISIGTSQNQQHLSIPQPNVNVKPTSSHLMSADEYENFLHEEYQQCHKANKMQESDGSRVKKQQRSSIQSKSVIQNHHSSIQKQGSSIQHQPIDHVPNLYSQTPNLINRNTLNENQPSIISHAAPSQPNSSKQLHSRHRHQPNGPQSHLKPIQPEEEALEDFPNPHSKLQSGKGRNKNYLDGNQDDGNQGYLAEGERERAEKAMEKFNERVEQLDNLMENEEIKEQIKDLKSLKEQGRKQSLLYLHKMDQILSKYQGSQDESQKVCEEGDKSIFNKFVSNFTAKKDEESKLLTVNRLGSNLPVVHQSLCESKVTTFLSKSKSSASFPQRHYISLTKNMTFGLSTKE